MMRSLSDHRGHDPGECTPACRWRGMYEGARLSMTDLNDKLLEAVGKHGRLRGNLISTMKRAFPQQFLAAERVEARRMSDQTDEVLLRYLQQWLTARPSTVPAGLPELRRALSRAGFQLPTVDDLGSWADAIDASRPVPAQPPAAAARQDQVSDTWQDAPAPPAAPPEQSADPGADELINLFDPYTPPKTWEEGARNGPGPVDERHPPADDLSTLFDDVAPAPPTDAAGRPTLRDLSGSAQGTPPQPDAPKEAPRAAEAVADTAADDADGENAPPDEQPPEKPVEEPDRPASAQTGAKRRRTPDGPPMRPQLIPSSSSKTRRRKPAKTTAQAASPVPFDVEQIDGDPSGDVPDTVRDRALALVREPRPLFLSDLIAADVGTEEQVLAWEQECRPDKDSLVRFIPAKSRHRSRGSLVLPYAYAKKAPAEFTRTAWARALDKYRGARLYELAVVLHRVHGELMSAEMHDNQVVMRLNQPRGVVGLLCTMGSDFSRNSDDRAALAAGVEELMTTPLALLVVVTTNHNALSEVIKAVEEEASERSWKPTFPVVASRSWEFAADDRSALTLVIDG